MEQKKKPQIRFKGFSNKWKQCKLDNFGKSTGGIPIESEFSEDGKYKVISIGSYSEMSIYNDQGIRCKLSNRTKDRVLNKDDITMILNDKTSSGNIIGRVLLIDKSGEYVYNQRTERIEINKEKYDPLFIYQLLNAPNIRKKIINESQGNTQIYVNWNKIKELIYYIPDIKEQKKLGLYFKNIDNLINLYQYKHDKLVQIKKSLLKKMFPKSDENIPEIRFKGFSDNWEQHKLDELGIIQTGNTPSTAIEEYYSKNGMQWVTPTDITDNIIRTTEKKLSSLGAKVGRIVPKNTILVTCIASIGKNAIVTEKSAFNQQINSLTPYFEKHNAYFLLADSINWSNTMKKEAGGLTFQIVNKSEFSKIETKIPKEKKEEEKLGMLFKTIDKLINLYQFNVKKLKNLKKTLLRKMFI